MEVIDPRWLDLSIKNGQGIFSGVVSAWAGVRSQDMLEFVLRLYGTKT